MTVREILEANKNLLTERDESANKGSYGKVLIVAGSSGMAGAAYLSGLSAFRSGIGMVRFLGAECNRTILQTLLPEAMYTSYDTCGRLNRRDIIKALKWADYVVMGPGLSTAELSVELVSYILGRELHTEMSGKRLVVIDADALNIIADDSVDADYPGSSTVITPHVGEMSRLTGLKISEIKDGAKCLAAEYGDANRVSVVLKDAVTHVHVYAGEMFGESDYVINSGCGAMAKAGSGDVLTGMLAGVTAVMKGNTAQSIPAAVWLHGRAGSIAAEHIGCHALLASDIAAAIPEAMTSTVC